MLFYSVQTLFHPYEAETWLSTVVPVTVWSRVLIRGKRILPWIHRAIPELYIDTILTLRVLLMQSENGSGRGEGNDQHPERVQVGPVYNACHSFGLIRLPSFLRLSVWCASSSYSSHNKGQASAWQRKRHREDIEVCCCFHLLWVLLRAFGRREMDQMGLTNWSEFGVNLESPIGVNLKKGKGICWNGSESLLQRAFLRLATLAERWGVLSSHKLL